MRRIFLSTFFLLFGAGFFTMAAAQSQDSHYSLFDRQSLDEAFDETVSTPTVVKSTAPAEELELSDEAPEPEYSGESWNKMREDTEGGRLQTETPAVVAVSSSSLIVKEEPQALPPSLEMPNYGTAMSVTGRKTIGFNYSSKHYLADQTTTRAQTVSTFD